MKIIFFLAVIFNFQVSFGQAPEEFCGVEGDCTEKMLGILSDYQSGTANFLAEPMSGYSGECYHLNFQYDPSTTHHGAFVFEANAGKFMTVGAFSFFAGKDPYAPLTVPELKNHLLTLGQPSPLSSTSDPVTLIFDYSDSQIRYWFRSIENGNQLLVIGQEAQLLKQNRIFCRMKKH